MIAVDTNVMVYAHREQLPQHERALEWLTYLAEGRVPWAIPVFCIGEFVRVTTHPRVFDPQIHGIGNCEFTITLVQHLHLRHGSHVR